MILKALIFGIVLLVVPIILGTLWESIFKEKSAILLYPIGFFFAVGIWHLICFPMIYAGVPFHILTWIYTILIIAICIFALFKKNTVQIIKNSAQDVINISKWDKWEILCLIIFIGIFGFIIYKALVSDYGDWTNDDILYVAYENAAIYDNRMFFTNEITGIYSPIIHIKYAFQTFLMFNAYLSKVFGIHVMIVSHTLLPVFLVLLSYSCYGLIGKKLFSKRIDLFIFLTILSLVYMYGLFSFYTPTFRLLGPIWQGKAILATAMLPFILTYYSDIIVSEYSLFKGIFLVILSLASVSFSLGGIITMYVISFALTIIYIKKIYSKKNIIYVFYAIGYPSLAAFLYLWLR